MLSMLRLYLVSLQTDKEKRNEKSFLFFVTKKKEKSLVNFEDCSIIKGKEKKSCLTLR